MNQINVSFRVTEEQQLMIRRAAAKARKTVSDYTRDIIGPWCASDLSERWPHDTVTPRPKSSVTLAAQKRGMSRDEFRQLAAELLAAADMGRAEAASHASGVRRKVG